jgi:trans-aconitate methyltransferase
MSALILTLVFFLLLFSGLVSIVIWSIRNGISPMPSSRKARRCILLSVPKDIQGKIVDLGSGWGTLAIPLAQQLPHCQIVGYESSPIPFFVSECRRQLLQIENLYFYRKDFFEVTLNDAALVVCYLYPEAMRKLKIKFLRELKPETWIISNTFAIPGWEPMSIYQLSDLYRTNIYVYRVPSC